MRSYYAKKKTLLEYVLGSNPHFSTFFFFTETKLKRGLKLKVLGSNPDVGMNEIVELEGSFLWKRVTLGVFSWPGF